jgi:hypothetical protein
MMRQLPWVPRRTRRSHPFWLAAQRRPAQIATVYVDANLHADVHRWDAAAVKPHPITVDIRAPVEWLSSLDPAQARAPLVCEWLLCLVIEPEFHEDRLGDYQERFADLWVPKFGRCGAVVVYVWHVLRQSRVIDWLIRAFGWGDPL